MSDRPVVVVPCFNEERRIDRAAFLAFVRTKRAKLLLVNDGSTDATEQVLAQLKAAAPEDIDAISLEHNSGKAEAVRRGLLEALAQGAPVVGYLDADLSTPFHEVMFLLDEAERTGARVVLGARVALLGRTIDRKVWRHTLGRVFATFASQILSLRVYDTQCGAKLFTASPALEEALREPFISRWAFDVELLGRLMTGASQVEPLLVSDFVEVPLREWRDVQGSKLSVGQMTKVLGDLARISADIQRRRRRRAEG